MEMGYIYHIIKKSEWQAVKVIRDYKPQSFDVEGFIHCSLADQVAATATRYYLGIPDLIVLKINIQKLKSEIRTEQAPNGSWYPHIYGELNINAVEAEIPLGTAPDGSYQFVTE
jgi:uncharacterized protein (DUF952 family)